MRVILTLADTWLDVDSKPAYMAWCGISNPDDFYTSGCARQLFQQHAAAMASRKNSANGRMYREDPTIFAWDLLNEPRCECWFNYNRWAAQALTNCRTLPGVSLSSAA